MYEMIVHLYLRVPFIEGSSKQINKQFSNHSTGKIYRSFKKSDFEFMRMDDQSYYIEASWSALKPNVNWISSRVQLSALYSEFLVQLSAFHLFIDFSHRTLLTEEFIVHWVTSTSLWQIGFPHLKHFGEWSL